MFTSNIWLSRRRAKIIVQDLEEQFLGAIGCEDQIQEALYAHPLYDDQMWLDIDWDYGNRVIGIYIGIGTSFPV